MSDSRRRAIAAASVGHLPQLCTVAEAARALRTSPRNLKRWIASGKLLTARVVRRGGSPVLIPRASIEALLLEALS